MRNKLMQAEVCAKMKYNVSKLSRIEQGQVPDWHNVAALLDIYGVTLDEYPHWENLWELSQVKGWWRAYGIGNHGYVALEHEAKKVCAFQMGYIPGLLQTPAYTRSVFETDSKPHSRKTTQKAIEIRGERQKRLYGDDPLAYHVVIYAPVLRHGCDKAQLLRLTETAALPNVTLQIAPDSGRLYDLWGSFTLFSFEDKDEPDIAYVDHRLGMAQTHDEEEVKAVRVAFKSILQQAHSPEASIALIKDLMT